MRFLHPENGWWVLGALALLPCLRLLARRRFAAATLVQQLRRRVYHATVVRYLPGLCVLAAIVLIGLGLMDPVVPAVQTAVQSRGLDIVIALDLSSSMQEQMEPKPNNGELPAMLTYTAREAAAAGRTGKTRLEATKDAIKAFVARRHDDRIGLVVFSDHAYVVSPLTFDHKYVTRYIDMVDDEILRGEGMTAIGDGLALANFLLARQSSEEGRRHQVVVLFTDGENNTGREPLDVLGESDAAGIRVHMVGVALEEEVRKKPAVQRLVQAVRRFGGRYFNANTIHDLDAASKSIDTIEKGVLVSQRREFDVPVFTWFAVPAFLCLTWALVLRAMPPLVDQT